MKEICILTDSEGEQTYIKNICKAIDDELSDDEILIIDSNNISSFKSVYESAIEGQALRPIIIYPYALSSVSIESIFADYPEYLVCQPLYQNLSNVPLLITTSPNRLLPIIVTSSGKEGVSGWNYAEALQFVESSFQFDSYDIIGITDNGDGTCWIKVTGDEYKWSYFVQQYNKKIPVYLKDVTGFSNNPDGVYYPIDENYFTSGQSWVKITHNVGTGSYSGSGGKAGFNFLSGGVSVAAAKLNKIRRLRGDNNYWASIVAARETGSNPVRDNEHGWGEINVDDAVDYDEVIPDDPHATLAEIETLDLDVEENTIGHFTMDEVLMAKKVKLFRNESEIYSKDMTLGESFAYDLHPLKLKEQTYYAIAIRDNQQTEYSNNQNTNLMAIINVREMKYGTGQSVYFMDNNIIQSGEVLKLVPVVSNPEDDSEGMQENKYILSGRSGEIVESKIWVSKGALLADLGGAYLNQISGDALAGIVISAFASVSNDLGGLRFDGDLSDYDFTGDIVQKTSFQGCTMPTGQTTPATFAAAVRDDENEGFLDPETTVWTTGALLSTLL